MSREGQEERGEPRARAARQLSMHVLLALRAVSMYPAAHPRVASAVAGLIALLKQVGDGKRWITLRLRGTQLGAEDDWIEADDPQLEWLVERMRSMLMSGIEFGPRCRDTDFVDFARAIAPSAARTGPAKPPDWPRDHPGLRVLDLVYTGHHGAGGVAEGAVARSASERSAAADARRQETLACLGASELLQQQLAEIETACWSGGAGDHVSVDLMAVIADTLPTEVASDAAKTIEVTGEILERVRAELAGAVRADAKIGGDALISSALAIAKRFMTIEAPERMSRRELPVGRPEDDAIEANLELLLAEYASLPGSSGELISADPDGPNAGSSLSAELLGIQLHALSQAQPAETLANAPEHLSDLLGSSTAEHLAVLDAYLRPASPGEPTRVGDAATLRLLALLTRIGRRTLIVQRGYCPAGLVRRTFPQSLPLAARVLGGSSAGLMVMRDALVQLGPTLASGGVESAVEAGVLIDAEVIRTLVTVGGDPPLGLLAAAASAREDAIEMLVGYARTLALPGAVAAVLRWVRSEDLPPRYLPLILQAAASRAPDANVQALSGKALREFIQRRRESLPLPQLLAAIESLREIPSAATHEFLRRLATEGRWTRWGAADRAVRRQAHQVLASPTLINPMSA